MISNEQKNVVKQFLINNNIISDGKSFSDISDEDVSIVLGKITEKIYNSLGEKKNETSIILGKGPKGDQGNTGPKGDSGDKGDIGEKGEKGESGGRGDRGDIGPRGERGERGPRGNKGSDAPSIEDILLKIENSEEFKHTVVKNGLVVSYT